MVRKILKVNSIKVLNECYRVKCLNLKLEVNSINQDS